jgi:transcriptional regulator with XRE-family HTH domain
MGEAAVRGALGISLEDLAEHLGTSRGTLTRYELNPTHGVHDAGKRDAIARAYRLLRKFIDATKGTARTTKEVDDAHQAARDVPAACAERGRRAQRRAG